MELETLKGTVPAILATLGPPESVYCEHGTMRYKDPTVSVGRKTISSGGFLQSAKRSTCGGISFFLSEFTGPGSVAFSRDGVGKIRDLELAPGEVLDVAEGSLLLAEDRIPYDMIPVQGTHRVGRMLGSWMDRLTGPGRVVCPGHGNILGFDLKPEESMDIDHGSLLRSDPTVKIRAVNQPLGGGRTGHALSFGACTSRAPVAWSSRRSTRRATRRGRGSARVRRPR